MPLRVFPIFFCPENMFIKISKIMSRFTSYYLYQKYEKVGDGEWTPTYPNEYSISGDSENTMPLMIKSENDAQCGYRDPIYRWADTEDTICVYVEDDPYANEYLTIESQEDNNKIYWKASSEGYQRRVISVSTDDGETWTNYISTTGGSGTTIATLNAGESILVKGENSHYAQTTILDETGIDFTFNHEFKTTGQFEAKGNIMSLISGDSFVNVKEFTSDNAFGALFRNCSGLTSAEHLVLPATTLSGACYYQMFRNCTSLTTAPKLPATTLAICCYFGMFQGCASLTTAPQLPAMTLASGCYESMFAGCRNLTTVPLILPATTLARFCYAYMFIHCTSLTTAPELPALNLVNGCYSNMFYDCSSLNYIKCLATNKTATGCTDNWIGEYGAYVAPTGTFVKNAAMTNWSTGSNGIPYGWTVQNA